MPKKKPAPAPIRPELIAPLTEILSYRGQIISDWPADEAAAYRDGGPTFREGRAAVHQARIAKAAAAIDEIIRAAEVSAFIDGVSSAQDMTGFTDETFESILAKQGYVQEPGS